MSVKGEGGGVPPKSVTFFLAKILSVKGGGGTPLTDKIRKVVFEVLPNALAANFLTLTGSLLIVNMKRANGVPETIHLSWGNKLLERSTFKVCACGAKLQDIAEKTAHTISCEGAAKEGIGSHFCWLVYSLS